LSNKHVGLASAALLALAVIVGTPRDARAEEGASGTWTLKPSVSLQSLLGARAGMFTSTGTRDSYGGGVSLQQSGYITLGALTMRATGFAALGSGSEGVEGIQTGDFGLGGLWHFTEHQGPFLRVGMRGYAMGNEAVWLSNFEIPSGYLGYQYLDGSWLFEAAGRTGLVVVGRHTHYATLQGFDVLERRRLGQPSAEIGGHATIGYSFVRAELEYMHVDVADTIGTPLDTWTASLCMRKGSWGGCLDYRTWKADVPRIDGTVSALAVGYGGISVGLWSP
jgi:hypothetical protein